MFYGIEEYGQTSVNTKTHTHTHTHTHTFGCERKARLLALHSSAKQRNCPTLLEPHNVTLSPGKRVGVGRGDGVYQLIKSNSVGIQTSTQIIHSRGGHGCAGKHFH